MINQNNLSVKVAYTACLLLAFVFSRPLCFAQPASAQQQTTKETLRALMDALTTEDRAKYDLLTSGDFRAYDNGQVYDRETFFTTMHHAHETGVQIKWSISNETVKKGGDLAVMYYLDHGQITQNGQTNPKTWLEVAVFERVSNGWRVNFIESQREIPPASPK